MLDTNVSTYINDEGSVEKVGGGKVDAAAVGAVLEGQKGITTSVSASGDKVQISAPIYTVVDESESTVGNSTYKSYVVNFAAANSSGPTTRWRFYDREVDRSYGSYYSFDGYHMSGASEAISKILYYDGPDGNVKTINGESIYGSGNITISGGGGITSKSLDDILTVSSSTTLAEICNAIMSDSCTSAYCYKPNIHETSTAELVWNKLTAAGMKILTGPPDGGFVFTKISTATDYKVLQVTYTIGKSYPNYNNYNIGLLVSYDGTTWYATGCANNYEIPVVSYYASSGPSTSLSVKNDVWNGSENSSQSTVPIVGIGSGITVSYQGTIYATDALLLVFYFHPIGSYDDDPANLKFDLMIMGKTSGYQYITGLTPQGFSVYGVSGGFSYKVITIA